MAEMKTKQSDASVAAFIAAILDAQQRADAETICRLMEKVTGEEPKMWGDSIVGFGTYHYVYASGREGDWAKVGFSPRKENLTLYFMYGFADDKKLMEKLGTYKTGKACLYIKHLKDVDLTVIEELVRRTFAHHQKH